MNGKPKTKLEPLPELKSDEAAERFVDDADLTQFDLSGGQRVHFEFERNLNRLADRFDGPFLQGEVMTVALQTALTARSCRARS